MKAAKLPGAPRHTVICANTRLARRLRWRHAQEQLQRGKRAWESLDILPWQAWLRRCQDALGEQHGTLLNEAQEGLLWQQVIAGSAWRDTFLQGAAVAAQAAQAWHSLKAYQAPPMFPEDMPLSEDAEAFKSWAGEFHAQCRHNHWTDRATLTDELLRAAGVDAHAFGSALMLVGFDRFTPQQRALFDTLKAGGIPVREERPADRNETVQVMDFADTDAELRAAARWARDVLEADDGLTLGIITPQLRNLRTRIRYTFEDLLTPGRLRYRQEPAPSPFSISAGQALTDYPLIHALFALLDLSRTPLPLETLGILLRTPFVRGYEQEQAARALLDERLRSRKQPALRWEDLLYLVEQRDTGGAALPVLAGMLRETRALLQAWPRRQAPEAWAESVARLLDTLGWPGERTLDSAEYQLAQAWHKALDELVSLRLVRPQMTRGEALSSLRRIAEGSSFQPETVETPLQVMDPQGAAAMAFDRVWMLGLSEDAWPPRAHPNPFIPLPLQKQYGMPGADAGATLEQTRALQSALLRSAQHVICSHARLDADRPLLVSPLLQGLPRGPAPEAPDSAGQTAPGAAADDGNVDSAAIFNAGRLETVEDTQAPPVRGRYGAGGAGLFQDQSQCPFRAFARRRLDSRGLDNADIGTDAMQRGSLLHELMRDAWSELHSQERLKAMIETGEIEAFVRARTEALLQGYRRRYPLVYTPRFAEIEAERLAQTLRAWLALERERAPFTVVEVEAPARASIGGIEFCARPDRVDMLEDGRRVLIDYKSGKAGVKGWGGARPDEPQLPLYAVTHPEPVAALSFARLKRGDTFGFEGLAAADGLLPGAAGLTGDKRAWGAPDEPATAPGEDVPEEVPDWEALLRSWRAVLERLAQEFRAGVATVTPTARACDWCDQQPLCRIHELGRHAGQGAQPDDE